MQSDWQPFIDRVIHKYEGGYGWNKKDRGGPTKYGITCYDLAEDRGQAMNSMSTWAPIVEKMTLVEAEDIYAHKYATGIRFNDLRYGVDACMGDYAINSGLGRPVLVACHILGLAPTSHMTNEIVAAINKADAKWFINAMCQERLAFMHGIRGGSDWEEFGHGWQARVDDIERYSTALALGAPVLPAPDLSKIPTPKAKHGDPHAAKKAGAAAGSAAPAAGTAHLSGAPPVVAVAVFVLIVAAAIGWFYFTQWKNNKANTTVVLPMTIPPQPVPAP